MLEVGKDSAVPVHTLPAWCNTDNEELLWDMQDASFSLLVTEMLSVVSKVFSMKSRFVISFLSMFSLQIFVKF